MSFALPEDLPPEGDRWSTWPEAAHGPHPRPTWLVTASAAVDTELGVLKSGKEADVHVLRRHVPGTDASCLLAAKRYRGPELRTFHRDASYTAGRRVKRSRDNRAMARRTTYGRELSSQTWGFAEFTIMCELWSDGLPVPYPVSISGREVLLELVTDDGATAAPRLASTRPEPALLPELWEQSVSVMHELAARGMTHGDLSPYNVLLHGERLVVIDWPQVVDIVANPQGLDFLHRDVTTMASWFIRRGLDVDPEETFADLLVSAHLC